MHLCYLAFNVLDLRLNLRMLSSDNVLDYSCFLLDSSLDLGDEPGPLVGIGVCDGVAYDENTPVVDPEHLDVPVF